jgi:hypothetical protein
MLDMRISDVLDLAFAVGAFTVEHPIKCDLDLGMSIFAFHPISLSGSHGSQKSASP